MLGLPTSSIAAVTEDPEYQMAIQQLLSIPPAVRALVDLSDTDKLYMSALEQSNLQLQKIGAAKTEFAGKASLAREKNAIDQTAGLATQTYYDWKTTAARDALNRDKKLSATSNWLGLANVGAGLYGASTKNDLSKQLLSKKLLSQYDQV